MYAYVYLLGNKMPIDNAFEWSSLIVATMKLLLRIERFTGVSNQFQRQNITALFMEMFHNDFDYLILTFVA